MSVFELIDIYVTPKNFMFSDKLISCHELNNLWHKVKRKRRGKNKMFKGHTWLEIAPFYEAFLLKSIFHGPRTWETGRRAELCSPPQIY